jgi:hypothetical protein
MSKIEVEVKPRSYDLNGKRMKLNVDIFTNEDFIGSRFFINQVCIAIRDCIIKHYTIQKNYSKKSSS